MICQAFYKKKDEGMHRYIQLITLAVFVIFASVSFADSDIMKPYPLPEAGYDRMVIIVPVK